MKTKSSILTVVLSFFLASGLLAQEKYEFATVVWAAYSGNQQHLIVEVSYSNGEFKKVEVDNKAGRDHLDNDQSSILAFLSTMSEQGWEVINYTNSNSKNWSYLLKRKIK